MSKFLNEFKDFAMRGNVLDLAVGVIIGGAFGKIVSSVVDDLLMPVIGMLIGGLDFKGLFISFGKCYRLHDYSFLHLLAHQGHQFSLAKEGRTCRS